jgi:hypothetical protein
MSGMPEVGDVRLFGSEESESGWVRKLRVTAVDGDRVTYEPADDDVSA